MNVCSACGLGFRAERAFARHRVGVAGGKYRRCRTPAELEGLGWAFHRNGRRRGFKAHAGWWTDQPLQQRLRLEA